jgi:hypothetical protein
MEHTAACIDHEIVAMKINGVGDQAELSIPMRDAVRMGSSASMRFSSVITRVGARSICATGGDCCHHVSDSARRKRVSPAPIQHPSLPIMIAVGGERVTLRQVDQRSLEAKMARSFPDGVAQRYTGTAGE